MRQLLLLEDGDQCIEGDNYLCPRCINGLLWESIEEEETVYACEECGAFYKEHEISIIVREIKP